jgi:TolA-binding protein
LSQHSPAAAARGHFYLGQSCYFLGDARTAIAEFIAAHSFYPEETAIWTQAALTKLGESTN